LPASHWIAEEQKEEKKKRKEADCNCFIDRGKRGGEKEKAGSFRRTPGPTGTVQKGSEKKKEIQPFSASRGRGGEGFVLFALCA